MASRRSQTKKTKLLSHSRPPTVRAKHATLSSKATRNLIRGHHRLLKNRAQALKANDNILLERIDTQIRENGGLEGYQLASRLGQSLERGGDSSKVLVGWLGPQLLRLQDTQSKLRMLEVGALSTKNACSMNRFLDVTRIDLNSQEPGILRQDFMEMPLPQNSADQFHIISLSLVLNYVPDAIGRGEMLKRCVAFLRKSPLSGSSFHITPRLFLVLPVACVKNSRYLTGCRLQDIMSSMGFVLEKSKETSKLIFQLWEHSQELQSTSFKKEVLRPGKMKNNFAIVVK
ncbi:putative methyltransferase-domain-containing protein [Aspergillus bertholletiae]|uniref:25S rRNA adenine-N(1) methyltransferase n=1 Tax=Aspergillus bertholletiae TaxID=1226010 RepID=A0A5N7BK41_9EURO|nr:putative methyltransferase-domain-containing protein [Aspergillus bertholletiae]